MLKQEIRQQKLDERKKINWFRRKIYDYFVYRRTINFLRNEIDPSKKNVSIFWSNKYEVNTHSIIRFMLKHKYNVSLPAIDEKYSMIMRKIDDLRFTKEKVHGCWQPTFNYPVVLSKEIDIYFIPLVAFDFKKNRLGYGKGCYDRYLIGVEHAVIIGLAYHFQNWQTLPEEKHDLRMSKVITNKGII